MDRPVITVDPADRSQRRVGVDVMPQAAFTQAVRAAINERKMTQTQLAALGKKHGFGWYLTTFTRIWNGERAITFDEAVFLAGLLHLDLQRFVKPVDPTCPHCEGTPPAGFTCNTCQSRTEVA